MGVGALVVEELGVDGLGEARVVELEAEVVAPFVRALLSGGSDLGAADEDAMGWGVLVGAVFDGDDADLLACTERVTISPVNSLPDFVKVPMVAMVMFLVL